MGTEQPRTVFIEGADRLSIIADAVRAGAHAFLKQLQARPKGPKSRGGLPCLMNSSPQVRRVWLAALDRYASSIARVLVEESGGKVSPLTSRLLGFSIVTIFSVILEEIGRATLRGRRYAIP